MVVVAEFTDFLKGQGFLPSNPPIGAVIAYFQQFCDIVYNGNFLKFSQNPELSEILKSTGDKIIAEASPVDAIWGIGLSKHDAKQVPESEWPGQNLLGKALMEVRGNL